MGYFHYHGTAKKLIRQGRLTEGRIVKGYKGISPALLLFFDDEKHPVMPIRPDRFEEYAVILPKEKIRLEDGSLIENEAVFNFIRSLL